jgi:hypothetical protein
VVPARPARTPGPLLRDFEAYWSAGSTQNAHADPYGRDIWNAQRGVPGVDTRRDEVLPFIGPPATLFLWSLLARMPYAVAAHVWLAILALTVLALVASVIRASDSPLSIGSFLTLLALAIAFGPVTSDLALGQVALLATLGAVAVVLLADRSLFAAVVGSCVASAQPNVGLGLASQLGRNRATLSLALGVIVTYLLGSLAYGWEWPLRYARIVLAHGNAERLVAIQLTPASIAYGFGAGPRLAEVAAGIATLAAIGAAAAIAFRVRDRFARLAAFATLIPFVAGFFHEHDLVATYIAAGWCALRTRGVSRAIALAGTLLVAIDWLGLAQRPTGIVQSTLLALAAFCAFAALDNEFEIGKMSAAAAPLALLYAGAAWIAARRPAPVWPDSLANFHAPAQATISAVWLAEQRAAGLLTAVPAWAFLRSLSLLGCALLAYAIYRHSSCCRTARPR